MRTLAAGLIAPLLGPLGACDALQAEMPNLQVEPDVERPAPDVQLPPVPNMEQLDIPPQLADGSYSVTGVWRQREHLQGGPVRVTGTIQSIYVCNAPDEALDEDLAELAAPTDAERRVDSVRPGCLRPHLHLVDDLRSRRRLLVTGYPAWHFEPQLSAGQTITVTGSYEQQTRGFISTEDGLVVATEFAGDGVLPVPPPVDVDAP
ncbi:MAG: hypothetical protein ACI82G_001898 [Bradymonadia bacterium]|jgi:hypothetical protein